MTHGSDLGVVAAVAALAAVLLAGPLVRAARRGVAGLARCAGAGARGLAARSTRRAALGLLGSGAVLATAAPSATAAPVAAGVSEPGSAPRPGSVTSPRAPLPAAPPAARSAPEAYVVVSGDTLWDIARRHLPPGASAAAVAEAWPRWWALNRARIGPDPALIHPGTRLVVPPRFRSTGTSTTAAPAAPSFDPDRR
jgi:resuscitation-promoting factor RpfA